MARTYTYLASEVRKYAVKMYNEGWDVVVEALTDDDIKTLIKGVKTVMGAKRRVSKYLKGRNDYAEEIANA